MGAIAGRDYDASADVGGGVMTEYGSGARGQDSAWPGRQPMYEGSKLVLIQQIKRGKLTGQYSSA